MAKNQNNNVAPATKKTGAEAKKDALATALAQIEKQFGKGAVMKLGDNTAMQVDAISTGSLGLGRDNSKQFLKDNPEIANDIEGQIRANADKLYASRRSSGRAAAADKAEEAAAPAEGTKEPVVKAPARSSESELDIMVED